jgi:ABC-type xylose transport system permease subunit
MLYLVASALYTVIVLLAGMFVGMAIGAMFDRSHPYINIKGDIPSSIGTLLGFVVSLWITFPT